MKHLIVLVAFCGLAAIFNTQELCDGFIPENDMSRPVGYTLFGEKTGITKEEFNEVNDKIIELYGPVVEELGGKLTINRLWSDDTVNASAQRSGSSYILNMYGGLARHETMNQDGFFVVACHEMGHQIGGAPKVGGFFNTWASNEGQSDYFSTFKCFRNLFTAEVNKQWVADNKVDELVVEKCESVFSDEDAQNTCKRSSMAGFIVARFFQTAKKEERVPKFDEPSDKTVSKTNSKHPATQCRLDTYFAASLCDLPLDDTMGDKDPNKGTCNRVAKNEEGLRPLCWYKPTVSTGGGDGGGNGGGKDKCPIPIPGFCDENGKPKFPFPSVTMW